MSTLTGRSFDSYDDCDPTKGTTEQFRAASSLAEGISGRLSMSARGENTERVQVQRPKSDIVGRPAPRDATDRYADNNGEWGPTCPGVPDVSAVGTG